MTKREVFKEMCLFFDKKSCDICSIKKDELIIIGFENKNYSKYRFVCEKCFVTPVICDECGKDISNDALLCADCNFDQKGGK